MDLDQLPSSFLVAAPTLVAPHLVQVQVLGWVQAQVVTWTVTWTVTYPEAEGRQLGSIFISCFHD